jgi:hypothetical protein
MGGKTDLTAEPEPERCLSSGRQLEFGLGFDAVYAEAKMHVTPASRLLACRKTAIKLPV